MRRKKMRRDEKGGAGRKRERAGPLATKVHALKRVDYTEPARLARVEQRSRAMSEGCCLDHACKQAATRSRAVGRLGANGSGMIDRPANWMIDDSSSSVLFSFWAKDTSLAREHPHAIRPLPLPLRCTRLHVRPLYTCACACVYACVRAIRIRIRRQARRTLG